MYMQVLNGCLAASNRQNWCPAVLYMQVLNERHAVTEFVYCRLTSVYMYLHACTVQFVCTHMEYNVHIHSLHAGYQWMSRSYTELVSCSVCIHLHVFTGVYRAVVCTHMDLGM